MKNRPDSDVHEDSFRILGWDAPKWFNHTPLALSLQYGATVRRAFENGSTVFGSIEQATLGLIQNMPFLNFVTAISHAIEEPSAANKFMSVTQQASSCRASAKSAAAAIDDQKRDANDTISAQVPRSHRDRSDK